MNRSRLAAVLLCDDVGKLCDPPGDNSNSLAWCAAISDDVTAYFNFLKNFSMGNSQDSQATGLCRCKFHYGGMNMTESALYDSSSNYCNQWSTETYILFFATLASLCFSSHVFYVNVKYINKLHQAKLLNFHEISMWTIIIAAISALTSIFLLTLQLHALIAVSNTSAFLEMRSNVFFFGAVVSLATTNVIAFLNFSMELQTTGHRAQLWLKICKKCFIITSIAFMVIMLSLLLPWNSVESLVFLLKLYLGPAFCICCFTCTNLSTFFIIKYTRTFQQSGAEKNESHLIIMNFVSNLKILTKRSIVLVLCVIMTIMLSSKAYNWTESGSEAFTLAICDLARQMAIVFLVKAGGEFFQARLNRILNLNERRNNNKVTASVPDMFSSSTT